MRLPLPVVAPALLLLLLLLRPITVIAQEFGFANDVAATTTNVRPRALTCPASDCTGSGILEHHLENGNFGTSVSCLDPNNNAFTSENSYFRCFASSLCSQTRIVDSVTFRVQKLEGPSIAAFVRLYKGGANGCASSAAATSLRQQTPAATASVTVNAAENFLVVVPIPGPFILLNGESLLVEINVPDLSGVGRFFMGDSFDVNQCDASYIQCNGSGNLQSTAEIGFGTVSYIITANTSPAVATTAAPIAPTPVTPTPPTPTPPTPTFAPISSAPVVPPEPTCFDDFNAALFCALEYLFGWLLPF